MGDIDNRLLKIKSELEQIKKLQEDFYNKKIVEKSLIAGKRKNIKIIKSIHDLPFFNS